MLTLTLAILSFFVYREIRMAGGLRMQEPRSAFTPVNLPPGSSPSPASASPRPAALSGQETERDKKIAYAIAKYGERPVVREFIEDLKKDPCAAKAIADGKSSNIVEALAAAREAGCLDKLKLKYAFRPEFIKLMAEVMSDREIGPLLRAGSGETPAPGAASGKASAAPQ